MYYVSKDLESSQDPAEPFRFVLQLIVPKLRPVKEVSFFFRPVLMLVEVGHARAFLAKRTAGIEKE